MRGIVQGVVFRPYVYRLAHEHGWPAGVGTASACSPGRYGFARQMLERDVRVFRTTSAGRLFDTAAALSGFTRTLGFEGQAALRLCDARGLRAVVCSGGAFQNQLLLDLLGERLRTHGLELRINHEVPANDGGISLGQAALADDG